MCPFGWQTTQQPFVTHSTAEAELVSYCAKVFLQEEQLRHCFALFGVREVTNKSFERVMYGDNAAAIGLAHGTTTSSWRTRHSRIRSSLLKEALDEKQATPRRTLETDPSQRNGVGCRWMHKAFEWTGFLPDSWKTWVCLVVILMAKNIKFQTQHQPKKIPVEAVDLQPSKRWSSEVHSMSSAKGAIGGK